MKKSLMFGFALMAAAATAACDSTTEPGVPGWLGLSVRRSTLTVGDTLTVWAQVRDGGNNAIPHAGVTFEYDSSDEDVATVEDNGKVTAVGAGAVTITGKAGKAKNSIGLNVVAKAAP